MRPTTSGETFVDRLDFSKSFLGSYVIGTLVALHLVGIAAASHRLAALLPARSIRYLASFTFSLCLFHYPLLFFFTAVLESTGSMAYRGALVTIGTLATVWALGLVTERRKSTVRRWLATILGPLVREVAEGET